MSTKAISRRSKVAESPLTDLIIDAIQDIKGKNIVKLDLRHLSDASVDFFIICEGDSTTQVKAISERIHKKVRDLVGISPINVEGAKQAQWILVDYFDIVVHIFYPETRAFYDLEDMWSDGKRTEYQNL